MSVTLGLTPVPKALYSPPVERIEPRPRNEAGRFSTTRLRTYEAMVGKVVNPNYLSIMLGITPDTVRSRLELFERQGLVARTDKPLTHGVERTSGRKSRWEWVGPVPEMEDRE